ncbi:type IV secretory system conjugative DNA transfer family protein [Mesomycoplasma conjunctivae]|nr:type IV secretory system conjugative DNA transfer family protein [Mesomycoplasma conjunctivae]
MISIIFSLLVSPLIILFFKKNDQVYSKDFDGSYMFYDELKKIGSLEKFNNKFLASQNEDKHNPGWIIKIEKAKKNKINYYVVSGMHTVILGDTRSGKTQKFIIPSIKYNINLKNPNSRPNIMVIDPKGELVTSLKDELESNGYKVILFNFKNLVKSDKINLLAPIWDKFHNKDGTEIENKSAASELLDSLIQSMHDWGKEENSFWVQTAKDILFAIAWFFLFYSKEDKNFKKEHFIFSNFNQFLNEKALKEGPWVKIAQNSKSKWMKYFYTNLFLPLIDIVPETLSGAIANLNTLMKKFIKPDFLLFSSKHEVDFNNLIKNSELNYPNSQPFAVFITFPLYQSRPEPFISAIINNCYSSLLTIAESKHNRKLDRSFLFFGDEFGNLPTIKEMSNKLSTAAGYNIYFSLILQNIEQLEKYKQEQRTILSNSSLKIFLRSNDLKSLEIFSKFAGKKETIKTTYSNVDSKKTNTEAIQKENIIEPWDLSQMLMEETWVLLSGEKPIHIKSDFAYQIWDDPKIALEDLYKEREDLNEWENKVFYLEESEIYLNILKKEAAEKKKIEQKKQINQTKNIADKFIEAGKQINKKTNFNNNLLIKKKINKNNLEIQSEIEKISKDIKDGYEALQNPNISKQANFLINRDIILLEKELAKLIHKQINDSDPEVNDVA